MEQFRHQVILITGAASGFGKLLAERLAAAGAKLILGDRNQQGLQALVESLPGEHVALACDVSKESQVKQLVETGVETFGQLDIAINNAGLSTDMKALIDTTEQDLDINFAVNTKGVFFGMKYQIPAMLKQGRGCILNVSSMAGINGAPKLTAYAAAKHAVIGITKTAAVEYAKQNIRINAVCPFYSPTPLIMADSIVGMHDFLAQGSPMKRLGEPEEMVQAMLMLCDPANTYMTGQAIAVDGGVSAL